MEVRKVLSVLTMVLIVAVPVGVAHAGSDVNIDPNEPFVQNEISLTLVPGQTPGIPAVLLAAYNDMPGATGLGVSHSTDGGTNWTAAQLAYPTNSIDGAVLQFAFDPTATADGQGNVYVGHIATSLGPIGGISGMYVHKGAPQPDGSIAWSTPVEVEADPASTSGPYPPSNLAYRFNDRCQIVTDPNANSLYVAWIKDRGLYDRNDPNNPPGFIPPSDIFFSSSSTIGTLSFPGTPTQINDAGQNLGNMPIPRVASNGTIYISWLDYDVWNGGQGTIWLDKSTDGGTTWGIDAKVTTTPIELPPLNVRTASLGIDALAKGAPVLEVSPSNPNELYIVYAADPDRTVVIDGPDDADIYLIKSIDGGASWLSPVRINDDVGVCDQILPWVDVKPNGVIDVVWYDRRNDLSDQMWDIYIARSTDGGASFLPNVQLNDKSFLTANGNWIGEYMGLAVDSDYAYLVWTSTDSDMDGDVYFDKIPNASIPEPATALVLLLGFAAALRRRK